MCAVEMAANPMEITYVQSEGLCIPKFNKHNVTAWKYQFDNFLYTQQCLGVIDGKSNLFDHLKKTKPEKNDEHDCRCCGFIERSLGDEFLYLVQSTPQIEEPRHSTILL